MNSETYSELRQELKAAYIAAAARGDIEQEKLITEQLQQLSDEYYNSED